MGDNYIVERHIEPINILIIFLIGLAAALFLIGSFDTFNIQGEAQQILIGSTIVLYLIAAVAFLWPKKKKTKLPEDRVIEKVKTIEKPVFRTIEKPIYKTIEKPVEKVIEKEIIKEVKKPVGKIAVLHVEKKPEPKKKLSKYVGSSYNEKYHLRNCRFAGAIKKQYLIEENQNKYFKLRGYKPCKVCHPELN